VRANGQFVLVALLAVLGDGSAQGQGSLEFKVTLTGANTSSTGEGDFILTDNLLTYTVSLAFGFSEAEVRGLGPLPDAPIILALDLTRCEVPGPVPGGTLGGCFVNGNEVLSPDQINGLVLGQWYVWGHSPTAPSRPLSGQLVPEPKPLHIFLMTLGGMCSVWLFRVFRSHVCWQKRGQPLKVKFRFRAF